MAAGQTEALNGKAEGLDAQPAAVILRLLADAQLDAARCVQAAAPAIAEASALAAAKLEGGGRLVYAAAGSSALMALADALELPGTFGIPRERVIVVIAGGKQALDDLAGAPEDDGASAVAAIAALDLAASDCLIALSASGSTPFAVAALEEGLRRGAATIGIANNDGTPLVTRAQVGIVLATPPEIIAGSTRMGAGTAQKIALNMLSTLTAVHLGHVHDGHMVNLKADNAKLRTRAARMVAAIAGCTADEAADQLGVSGGLVKPAVLMARGAANLVSAEAMLARHGHRLRHALAELESRSAAE